MFVLCLGFVLGTLLYRCWLFFARFLCFAFSHTPFHSLFISLYLICPFTRLFLLRCYLRTYSLFLWLLCFYSQRSDSKGVGCPHDDSLVLWGRQLGVLHFDPVLIPATWRERRPSAEGLSPARLLLTKGPWSLDSGELGGKVTQRLGKFFSFVIPFNTMSNMLVTQLLLSRFIINHLESSLTILFLYDWKDSLIKSKSKTIFTLFLGRGKKIKY